MNVTADYVSKYVNLLNTMSDDENALVSFKVSILYSQRNPLNEKQSTNIQNHCQQCLTHWKRGNLTVKTIPKRKNKKSKLHKMQTTEKSFIMVTKCLLCLNVSSSVFSKSKKLKDKSIKKTENSVSARNIDSIPNIAKEKLKTLAKKKKKKRNLYAGLNPLVFKNRNLSKKKKNIVKTCYICPLL